VRGVAAGSGRGILPVAAAGFLILCALPARARALFP
jgi:hypothetical protein